jgi:DNA-binding GntR family transcriptional regulator
MAVKPKKRATRSTDGAKKTAEAPARGLLKERAYIELKGLILEGALEPGGFLAERQLAVRLGMSKTPIRSALERLESEGFVRISPQQGAIVRDLSLREIADQYEIRIALESYIVRSLAGRLTPEQTRLVETNLEAQRVNLETGDVRRGVALDEEFHALFGDFLGNHEILRVMGQLREKIHRVILQVFKTNFGRMVSSYEEHRGIAEAIIQGDPASASRRIEEHLRFGKEALLSPRRS